MIEIAIQKRLDFANGKGDLAINMNIEAESLVTFYGKSGAGKTTILRMLAGLVNPDAGIIKIHDKVWFDKSKGINLSPQQRNVGFVFQDYALFPNMTVRENLFFALKKEQSKKIIEPYIEIMELEALQHRKPQKLSGGQKQRVALARALIQKPDILILDEPLSALDYEMRTKLQQNILQVHQTFGFTTILVSHDLPEIYKMSDKVFVIEHGKIIKHGTPSQVFSSSQIEGQLQLKGTIISISQVHGHYQLIVKIGTNEIQIPYQEKELTALNIGDEIEITTQFLR